MIPAYYGPISFPTFGIEVNPPRNFELGPLTIYFYGVIIALGLFLAVAYSLKRRKQFGLLEDDILDGVLWIVPFAILCARLYYCIFQWDSYKSNPISILYIWEGGIAIYGAVIGAAIGVFIHCKFIKKISILATLDLVSLGFMIGQMLGRWGNFFNREAFGAETESFLRMGLYLTADGSFSYEGLGSGSTMTTAITIDNTAPEALDIDVMTERERSLLMEEWAGKGDA